MLLRLTLATAVTLALAQCSTADASAPEKAACRTFHQFEASNQAAEIQDLRTKLQERATASGNEVLRQHAREFEAALDRRAVDDAGAAVGKLREECERLGVER